MTIRSRTSSSRSRVEGLKDASVSSLVTVELRSPGVLTVAAILWSAVMNSVVW